MKICKKNIALAFLSVITIASLTQSIKKDDTITRQLAIIKGLELDKSRIETELRAYKFDLKFKNEKIAKLEEEKAQKDSELQELKEIEKEKPEPQNQQNYTCTPMKIYPKEAKKNTDIWKNVETDGVIKSYKLFYDDLQNIDGIADGEVEQIREVIEKIVIHRNSGDTTVTEDEIYINELMDINSRP